MIWTILRREAQEGLASFTFLSALILLTVLVPLSAYTQAAYYRQVLNDYASRQKMHKAENTNHSIMITRPVPPLLLLFNGMYDSLPDEVTLRSDSISKSLSSEDIKPLDWISPKIDLGMVIGILLTLVAILLGHDAVSGEREQGTLKLLLSTPIQRYKVLAAKLIGVIGLIGVCFVYAVVWYIIVASIFSRGAFVLIPSVLVEVLALMLIGALTLMVFATLSVTISSIVRHSSVALALSLAIWASSVLIWPTIGPYIVSTFWPVTPTQAVQREIFNREAGLIKEELADHKRTAEELSAKNVDVEVAWKQYLDKKRAWIERRKTDVEPLLQERVKEISSQQAAANTILSLSPYGAFTKSLGTLCGTGLEDYNHFLALADRYEQQEFLPASFESLSQEKPWISISRSDKPFELQPFDMPARPLSARLADSALPLIFLIAQSGLLAAVGFFKFARYDVQ